jgi:hypothetical protein
MSKKKEIRHSTKKCDGLLETQYTDDSVPVLVCDKCGHRIEDWVKWHLTYSDFWKDKEKWEAKKDHLVVLLGYFSHLYYQYYNTTYTLSLSEKGLFRGPEIHQIRRMYGMLDSNALMAKHYMEWLFETKVRQRKRKITSLGFLATPGIITEYKLFLQRSMKIRRNTPIPVSMLEWIAEHVPEISNHVTLADHGDLHVMLSHYKRGHLNDVPAVNTFVNKLQMANYINKDFVIQNWSE